MGTISVGVAVAIGGLIGILLAPRKGSETREQIVQRSKPLQEAARNVASKSGDAIAPITKMAGEKVPLIGRDKDGDKLKEPAGEAGDKNSPVSNDRDDGPTSRWPPDDGPAR